MKENEVEISPGKDMMKKCLMVNAQTLAYIQICKHFERNIVITFIPISLNMDFGCSKESSEFPPPPKYSLLSRGLEFSLPRDVHAFIKFSDKM